MMDAAMNGGGCSAVRRDCGWYCDEIRNVLAVFGVIRAPGK